MSPLLVLGAALLLQAPEPVRRLGTQQFNHPEILVAVAMSPDGRVLATGDGKFCRLWNAETGAPIGDPVAGGRCLAFSPDGMLVASGDSTQVQILDAATGKSEQVLAGHFKGIVSLCFSPDGTRLASGSDDVTVRVWNVKTGREIYRLEDHLNTVFAIAWSPDGTILATGSRDGTLRLRSAEDGKTIRTLTGHAEDVRAIRFVGGGETLLSAGGDEFRGSAAEDTAVHVWKVANGERIGSWPGHLKTVRCMDLSSDGAMLATASVDGDLRLWDVKAGRLRRSIKAGWTVRSLSLSKDRKRVVVAGDAQVPRQFDVETGAEVTPHEGHRGSVQSLQVVGNRVVAGDRAGDILVWDLNEGRVLRRIGAHQGSLNRIEVSGDGTRVASLGADKVLRIHRLDDGTEQARIPVPSEWPTILIWLDREDAIVTGHGRKPLDVYDSRSGSLLRSIPGTSAFEDAAFSPDGRLVASTEKYSVIRLREVSTGEVLSSVTSSSVSLHSVAFHPTGRWLVTGASGFLVRDVVDGGTSDLGQGGPRWPVFTGDGRFLAGFDWGKGFRVIEFASGREILTIPIKPARFTACDFVPGTWTLVAGTTDTTLAVWSWAPDLAAVAGKELEALWTALGEGPGRAEVEALVSRGGDSVRLLKDRLGARSDPKVLDALIARVADSERTELTKAVAALVEHGGEVEAPLLAAIDSEKDEARNARLTKARDELLAPVIKSPATLRRIRAMEVLERIGTPEAVELLVSLSTTAVSQRERQEAAWIVKRIKK